MALSPNPCLRNNQKMIPIRTRGNVFGAQTFCSTHVRTSVWLVPGRGPFLHQESPVNIVIPFSLYFELYKDNSGRGQAM